MLYLTFINNLLDFEYNLEFIQHVHTLLATPSCYFYLYTDYPVDCPPVCQWTEQHQDQFNSDSFGISGINYPLVQLAAKGIYHLCCVCVSSSAYGQDSKKTLMFIKCCTPLKYSKSISNQLVEYLLKYC